MLKIQLVKIYHRNFEGNLGFLVSKTSLFFNSILVLEKKTLVFQLEYAFFTFFFIPISLTKANNSAAWKTTEPKMRNPRVSVYSISREVWLLSLESDRKLKEALGRLKEVCWNRDAYLTIPHYTFCLLSCIFILF